VTKNEVEDHTLVASQMNWDQLASIIIYLELEKIECKAFLKKSELKQYNKLLDIYEAEKNQRVETLTTWNPYH